MEENIGLKRKMIIRFHALLSEAGIGEEGKLDMLSGYGVESSKELSVEQLETICDFVQGMVRVKDEKKEKMRKRAIRAVCKFAESMTPEWGDWPEERRLGYAKAVICRAAMVENFNRIGVDRLRSIAYSFEKQKKDMDDVVDQAMDIMKDHPNPSI